MNVIKTEGNIVSLPKDNTKNSIVDGRKRYLARLAKMYPPLDSFQNIDIDIFDNHFTCIEDLYYTVHIYAEQMQFKVKEIYGYNRYENKITFKCKERSNCTFSVVCHYQGKNVRVKYTKHNHALYRANGKKINNLNTEIRDLVTGMVKHSNTTSPDIIRSIKQAYNLSDNAIRQIELVIRKIRCDMRDEICGLYNFYSIIEDKCHYKDDKTTLVIIDKEILYRYSTVVADGTFGVFLSSRQLYLIYSQISPSKLLLVAFAITSSYIKISTLITTSNMLFMIVN